jgi:superfamily I DNA/RNA helicase
MLYSIYQIALFDFIQFGEGSAIVDAKAGSGKTTSILEACNRLPEDLSVLFLAFNKSIVGELKTRLPSGINCSTFNSCGWAAWRRFTGRRYIKIDAKKNWRIIWDNFEKEDQRMYGAFCAKMVGLAKSTGLTPDDNDSKWFAIQDHHGVLLSTTDADYDRGIFLAKRVLERSIEMAYEVCDFDDQLYMPWLMDASFEQYGVVFIDEAQDTNSVQADLIRRMLMESGRVIAVGDPFQAIYGFRGADHNAMNNLAEIFNATTLPLSISYRCSQSVVREAQKYVSGIESFEDSPEGAVETLQGYDIDSFSVNDAILCRNNAPLIEMAYQIIARGKGVNFLGRDIGGGLKTLIKNMEARTLDSLSEKLEEWLVKESAKLVKKRQEDKLGLLEDRVNCIEIFIRYLPNSKQTVGDLLEAVDSLFQSKGRGVTLSSVHKSKGREWVNVHILGFDKYMPSKYAKKDWQLIQETNLIYVAITRAKSHLTYINENDWTDEPNLVIPERTRKPVQKAANVKPNKSGMIGGFNPFGN